MKVWKYGDDINTDMLFPGKYTYTCSTAQEIMPHLLEDLDPEFARTARKGDILLAGKNFGCGSSREQPALGLKSLGIQAVIAAGFARIFYRASINQGLLLVECPEAVRLWKEGMGLVLDPSGGLLSIGEKSIRFPRVPEEIMGIMEAGGLLQYTKQRLERGLSPAGS